jgi:hypothetical protein
MSKGGFLSTAISLGEKAFKVASKKSEIPCGQTKMFTVLNKRIKKTLSNNGVTNKIIKEGEFERVIISGKGFSKSPQPLMDGKWQLKVVEQLKVVKYIFAINNDILKFKKFCKYQSQIQNINEGDQIEIICFNRNGDKHKSIISGSAVKSNKFILHKFRTDKEGVLAFVVEFM